MLKTTAQYCTSAFPFWQIISDFLMQFLRNSAFTWPPTYSRASEPSWTIRVWKQNYTSGPGLIRLLKTIMWRFINAHKQAGHKMVQDPCRECDQTCRSESWISSMSSGLKRWHNTVQTMPSAKSTNHPSRGYFCGVGCDQVSRPKAAKVSHNPFCWEKSVQMLKVYYYTMACKAPCVFDHGRAGSV